LRIVLCVWQTGSFRQAASRLDMAPSTLSHAVTALEESLGFRLFHRTTRSVAPTLEGSAFLIKIEPLVSQIDSVLMAPTEERGDVRGGLRINVSLSAGLLLLRMERYPKIEVDLRHDERLVDIVAEGCDAGIRIAGTVPEDMIGVPFGERLFWSAVAAPSYIEKRGEPLDPRDLANHRCIRIRLPSAERYFWDFRRDDEHLKIDVPGRLTLDRIALMVEAALGGIGIAYVPLHTIEQPLASGALTKLFPDWFAHEAKYLLYYPGRRAVPPQLRAFIDFLRTYGAV
jgi:DNA-binding transcriptional LysR family regulator